MGPLEGIIYGLEIAVQPENLLAAVIGVLIGSLVGAIPGLGPGAGAAILFPLTYAMGPAAGLIMLAGIYYGVMYGGSTSAVLLNIPGEAVSIVASFEGHPLAKQGKAGTALGIIAIGSFISGTLSVVVVTIASPQLASVGLLFGPVEFFALTLGGLVILSRMLGGSFAAGVLPMLLGLILGTVGIDVASGAYRYTFGSLPLSRGIGIVPAAIGLFGISEMLRLAESRTEYSRPQSLKWRELLPSLDEIKQSRWPWVRGGIIGFLIGLLPGPSATLSTFISYRVEKAVSKGKHLFGKGAIEGLAGPEAANNAAATASMIPVLALGLPFSPILALMLAALITHGVDPGPQIAVRHPEIFWAVIASMYIGNLLLLWINIPMIGMWVRALSIRKEYLIPGVIVLSGYGSFAVSRQMLDVILFVGFGLMGYAFRLYGFQLAPLIVGLILGPMVERHFVAAMTIGRGDPSFLFSTAVARSIWIAALIAVLASALVNIRKAHLWRQGRISARAAGRAPESSEQDEMSTIDRAEE